MCTGETDNPIRHGLLAHRGAPPRRYSARKILSLRLSSMILTALQRKDGSSVVDVVCAAIHLLLASLLCVIIVKCALYAGHWKLCSPLPRFLLEFLKLLSDVDVNEASLCELF